MKSDFATSSSNVTTFTPAGSCFGGNGSKPITFIFRPTPRSAA